MPPSGEVQLLIEYIIDKRLGGSYFLAENEEVLAFDE
jgi:hypothetical protein